MINSCHECKHWSLKGISKCAVPEIGKCNKVVMLWEATEWKLESDWLEEQGKEPNYSSDVIRAVKPEYAQQMSFISDASDYAAWLWTKPHFFCAHFEIKETDDENS